MLVEIEICRGRSTVTGVDHRIRDGIFVNIYRPTITGNPHGRPCGFRAKVWPCIAPYDWPCRKSAANAARLGQSQVHCSVILRSGPDGPSGDSEPSLPSPQLLSRPALGVARPRTCAGNLHPYSRGPNSTAVQTWTAGLCLFFDQTTLLRIWQHLAVSDILHGVSDSRRREEGRVGRTRHFLPHRLALANRCRRCNICRRRKTACDRGRPKCSLCTKSGLPCEYNASERHPGLRAGYVAQLEKRLGLPESS